MMNPFPKFLFLLLTTGFLSNPLAAQMITGFWQGKVGNGLNSIKLELKIVSKGDSLTGTSYYYSSSGNYTRYSVKGYFDPQTNAVVWWDDELIERKQSGIRIGNTHAIPLLTEADFNCPGSGKMMLNGKSQEKGKNDEQRDIHLTKTDRPQNKDEWDELIENYTMGGNDPELIGYTETIWKINKDNPVDEHTTISSTERKVPDVDHQIPIKEKEETTPPLSEETEPKNTNNNNESTEDKFISRTKKPTVDILLEGDSIEVSFYDNALVDGDSISLFLNETLIYQNIRLTDKAFAIKLSIKDLKEINELVMVAENLGSIPPNTSFMVAVVNGKRFTANLESTEKSSAMIRLQKPK
jgi:hypothetical protein